MERHLVVLNSKINNGMHAQYNTEIHCMVRLSYCQHVLFIQHSIKGFGFLYLIYSSKENNLQYVAITKNTRQRICTNHSNESTCIIYYYFITNGLPLPILSYMGVD